MSTGNRLTVLQVVPRMNCGDTERDVIEYALAVREIGGVPLVASAGGKMVNDLRRLGIEHIQINIASKNPFKILFNANTLATLVKERGISLIHARSRTAAWCAKIAARKANIPFVTSYYGPYADGRFGYKRRYNAVMTQGNAVFAPSLFIKNLLTTAGVDESKIYLLPACIDERKFDIGTISMDRLIAQATKWRLPDDEPILLFPSRLKKGKGYATVLDALSKMRHKKLLCLFVDEAVLTSSCRRDINKRVKRLHLESVVQCVDFCTELDLAYASADVILCLRAREEASSRTVLETQSMGRLAIAYDHGGIPELISNGETGFLAKPNDATDLATVLDAALDLAFEDRQKIITRARDFLQMHYGQKAVRAAIGDAYRRIALNE